MSRYPRLMVVTAHGEATTLWYVVDPRLPEAEQPAVVSTFDSPDEAERYIGRRLAYRRKAWRQRQNGD